MSRRGRNEGSIFRRKDGLWAGTVSLGYGAGRRRRRTFYGKTREEVANKLADAVRDHRHGINVDPERKSVAEFLNDWLETSVRPHVRPSTFTRHQTIVRAHLVPSLGRIRLQKLQPRDVQAMLSAKTTAGLSPRSVQYIRAVLRTALAEAERLEDVRRNVAALVKGPRVERREIQPLTPTEARQFLKAAESSRLYGLYAVALGLGLRQGEALGLRWEDVDLDGATLSVRRILQRVGDEYRFLEPKTVRSARTIGLPAVTVDALRAHKVRQLEERLRLGPAWEDSGLIFSNEAGAPLYGPFVTRHMQKILREAGIRRQRFHDLRHACASFLLAQGVPDRVVMEVLGHSQIATTMNIYAHVLDEMKREAATRMDALLGAGG